MVLKHLALQVAPILKVIYTRSLVFHQVPNDWRLARICPVYKNGEKDCLSNYWPISLTCICSKIMEHIITNNITTHLNKHNIIYRLQHGFRSGRSCETQLLELTTTLHSYLAARKQTYLGVLDFSKGLDYYGMRGNIQMWIQAFLSDRR